MKIKTFKVERWMDEWENDAVYNLAETCIDSMTVGELLEMGGISPEEFAEKIAGTRMTYSHIFGSPELKAGIAGLYQDVKPEHVVPTHGATGANAMVLETLIEPSDNMISVMPTYQQHYSIPEAIGAEVRILKLKPENGFLPDIEELRSMVDENTRMITINNPNNPTGAVIPDSMLKEIVEIAKSVGCFVLADEVYRGISEDGSYMTSVVDLYDKGISVGSMSKTFSLAGLRMGWIVTKDMETIRLIGERRDYNTISCGIIDDMLAAIALENKEKVLKRNAEILLTNRRILDEWVNATSGVSYVKPQGGTTAFVYYGKDMPSRELCADLMRKKGVLFVPGECFEMEGAVRIGYAFDSKLLKEGLDKFAEYLNEI